MPLAKLFDVEAVAAPKKGQAGRTLSCVSCGLYRSAQSPKMAPHGRGLKRLMTIGEGPGDTEDRLGRPWQGKSGTALRRALRDCGVDLDSDCVSLNTVNCFVLGTEVRLPSPVKKSYMRMYSGQMVRVVTSSGACLTGTPNHPIFTKAGEVPLGHLKQGDDVLKCSDGYWVSGSTDPDIQTSPAKIEKVFDSISVSSPTKWLISPVDFHGDGLDGDVDVVRSNGELWNKRDAVFVQKFNEMRFSYGLLAESSLPCNTGPLLGSGIRYNRFEPLTALLASVLGSFVSPSAFVGAIFNGMGTVPRQLSLASISDFNTVLSEKCDYCGSFSSSKLISDLRGAYSRFVEFNYISRVSRLPGMSKSEPFGLGSQLNSIFYEKVFGSFCADTVQSSDVLKAHSGLVEIDYVNSVEKFHYDGPVYNFETEDGFYIAQGLIVSNCRPPSNRAPTPHEAACCRARIVDPAIAAEGPRVILLLGGSAVSSVVGSLYPDADDRIGRWRGWTIPIPELGCWVCPTFHPSYVLREERRSEIRVIWEQDVQAAVDRLRDEVPAAADLRSMVEILRTDDEIVAAIELVRSRRRPVSFDYETEGLRALLHAPVCASFAQSTGRAHAFMFRDSDRVRAAWAGLLSDPEVGKISHNLKFEAEWSFVHFGVDEVNWAWDSMQAAHVLDNRPGICGLKHQLFVVFGIRPYDGLISPYLKSVDERDPAAKNRLREFIERYGEDEALYYCGIDSLGALRLARRQMRQMGVGP